MEVVSESDKISNNLKARVWSIPTIPKIQIFLWRALSGALAVAESLISHGIQAELSCPLCGASSESINHVLFLCVPALKVWCLANFPLPLHGFSDSLFETLNTCFLLWNWLRCLEGLN